LSDLHNVPKNEVPLNIANSQIVSVIKVKRALLSVIDVKLYA